MEPLLDMMGLGGSNFVYFGKAIKLWGDSTSGLHFPVTVVTESSLVFNVPKCLGKFVFKFGSGVLINDAVGSSVCQ